MLIYCGIDFGTTNTVVSIVDREGKLIDSFSLPTVFFIPQGREGIERIFIGKEALGEYERGASGRFVHSIKRSLSDPSLTETLINGRRYPLSSLVQHFLQELDRIMEKRWGFVPRNIVLGHPVRFSEKQPEDQLARERLLEGFRLAGYRDTRLLQEPVAAALCFEEQLKASDRNYLIIDLGGGTSDFSLIQLDPGKPGIERYKVLAVGGINIGGDDFDEEVMFRKISPLLGAGSTYDSMNRRMPMPVHLYRDISRWNRIQHFDRNAIQAEFSDYEFKATDKAGVKKLKQVMLRNLSNRILHRIRSAKHELSERDEVPIRFHEEGMELAAPLSLSEFNRVIHEKVGIILSHLESFTGGTEISRGDIDRVIITGGSSRVDSFGHSVRGLFDEERVLTDGNFYNSVSLGLARYAWFQNLNCL